MCFNTFKIYKNKNEKKILFSNDCILPKSKYILKVQKMEMLKHLEKFWAFPFFIWNKSQLEENWKQCNL